MATTTSTITPDGVSIHASTIGAGPDLVLVHGITDSSGTWGPIPGLLADRYRVTTIDLRGHGESGDAPGYDSVAMAGDLAAVVAANGIASPLLVGHSLGGVVVTVAAAATGARGVVVVDQALQLSAFQAALLPAEAMLRDPASFPVVIEAVFEGMNGERMTSEVRAAIAANRRPRQDVVLGVWDLVLTSTVDQLDEAVAALAGTVTAPLLALQYMEAPAGYDEFLHRVIPQAVLETAPAGSGHYEHLLDPERFVQRVVDFDASLG